MIVFIDYHENIVSHFSLKINKNFLQKSLDEIPLMRYTMCVLKKNVRVAQLDRVTGYEPVDRGFESLHAHQELCSNYFILF